MSRKQDDVREAVIRTACDLLSAEGAEALTIRRIAAGAGTSTMALYTGFGGKDGVVAAVYTSGFVELERAVGRAMEGDSDPVTALVRATHAYRRFGIEHAAYYGVMFQRTVPGFEPDDECQQIALRSLGLLAHHVQRAIDEAGVQVDAQAATLAVWSLCHGATSLELDMPKAVGPDPAGALEAAMRAMLHGLGLGADTA